MHVKFQIDIVTYMTIFDAVQITKTSDTFLLALIKALQQFHGFGNRL